MPTYSKEARVLLALDAVQNDEKLSLRAIVRLYNVLYNTLRNRYTSKPIRYDILANSYNLMDLEEQTIVQYVIELSICVFPPRLYGVEDIANYLRRECNVPPCDELRMQSTLKGFTEGVRANGATAGGGCGGSEGV